MREGQTYFYENIIGRSRAFIELMYPKLKELFPNQIERFTPDDLYLAVNKVNAGPIRIGSDEVSNNLHILVRYEIEKALMDKSLSVKDLPDAWAEKYKEYLGVEVSNPVQGVLQDIHWAHGSSGYFPTSLLGRCYSAITAEKMREEVSIESEVLAGDFSNINQWNKDHIWRKAGLYETEDVMKEIAGWPVTADAYIKYLKAKYSELYSL